jgi:potassium/hydrogen antiporter
VPIILAMYPLLFGLADGAVLFNVVFFVVLVSATLQGWTLPPLARRLGLQEPPRPDPPATLEITALKDVNADIVEYVVAEASRAAGRAVRDLGLPDDVVLAMISRGPMLIPPRGSTEIAVGDHVFVVLRADARAAVDTVFGRAVGN